MLVINPVVTMKIYVWAKLIDEHMPFDTTNWKKEKKKESHNWLIIVVALTIRSDLHGTLSCFSLSHHTEWRAESSLDGSVQLLFNMAILVPKSGLGKFVHPTPF